MISGQKVTQAVKDRRVISGQRGRQVQWDRSDPLDHRGMLDQWVLEGFLAQPVRPVQPDLWVLRE